MAQNPPLYSIYKAQDEYGFLSKRQFLLLLVQAMSQGMSVARERNPSPEPILLLLFHVFNN